MTHIVKYAIWCHLNKFDFIVEEEIVENAKFRSFFHISHRWNFLDTSWYHIGHCPIDLKIRNTEWHILTICVYWIPKILFLGASLRSRVYERAFRLENAKCGNFYLQWFVTIFFCVRCEAFYSTLHIVWCVRIEIMFECGNELCWVCACVLERTKCLSALNEAPLYLYSPFALMWRMSMLFLAQTGARNNTKTVA